MRFWPNTDHHTEGRGPGYVGRVGALAVALGIGTALGHPGVAAADTPDSSASTTASSARSADTTGRPGTSGGDSASSAKSRRSAPAGAPTTNVQSSGGALTSSARTGGSRRSRTAGKLDSGPTTATPAKGSDTGSPTDETATDPDSSLTASTVRTSQAVATTATVDDPAAASEAAAIAAATSPTSLAAPASADTAGTVATATQQAASLGPVETVVSTVLRLFGFDPGADPDLPFGMAVLAWVRREFEHALFNKAPTIDYDQTTNSLTDTGAITGSIGAQDPEGDPLVYKVIQDPASGTVTLDGDSFAYRPQEPMEAGDTDQFVVAVSDTGPHLHGLDSLLSPFTAGTTTATITIAAITSGEPTEPPVVPAIRISDATTSETNSGTADLDFAVTLSEATDNPVTVAYQTSDGTASAGADYTAASGTLTFATGETSKTVTVNVAGDTTVEPDETLTITLSNASGATIADAEATGTITNDDGATTDATLSISDATAAEPDPSTGAVGDGWFHTDGNQIVDAAGNPVEIAGVNWFGFESDTGAPHGLWTRNYKGMMDQMAELGFNTIRVPYSNEMLDNQNPSGIDYSANPELEGMSSLEVMDAVVEYAGEVGLKVILDHHRNDAGVGTSENGLWYNSNYSESDWINDWVSLAQRYADNPTVIGFDLHNEPWAGTWGGGGANDWAAAAERAGDAVLAVNPNLLVIVEGVGTYDNQSYWWGGNLQGVKDRPIQLDVANQLVYSPHDYPNSVYAQPWFSGDDFGANLPNVFEDNWGYIYTDDIAPIYVGEFGTRLTDPKDIVWYEAITSYLSGDFDDNGTLDIPAGEEPISWTYWSWNPNSGDTGGILADDWNTVNQNKVDYLEPIMFDFADGGATYTLMQFTVTLSEVSDQTVTVGYATSGGTASEGGDYVGTSGTVTFLPGETSKTVGVVVLGDTETETDETFTVALSGPSNATIADGTAVGAILDHSAA